MLQLAYVRGRMRRSRVRVIVVSGVVPLFVSATAFAAAHCLPCHPDPFGTKLLSVPGTIDRYSVDGPSVRVEYTTTSGCVSSYLWRTSRARLQTSAPIACSRSSSRPLFLPSAASNLTAVTENEVVKVRLPRRDEPV